MFFDFLNFNPFAFLMGGHSTSNVAFVNQGNVQIAMNIAFNSPGAIQNATNIGMNSAIIYQR